MFFSDTQMALTGRKDHMIESLYHAQLNHNSDQCVFSGNRFAKGHFLYQMNIFFPVYFMPTCLSLKHYKGYNELVSSESF